MSATDTTTTATFVRRVEGSWAGDARLWRLSRPITRQQLGADLTWRDIQIDHVVTSAVTAPVLGMETAVFAVTASGADVELDEWLGAVRQLDHEAALRDAGIEVADPCHAVRRGEFGEDLWCTTHGRDAEDCAIERGEI